MTPIRTAALVAGLLGAIFIVLLATTSTNSSVIGAGLVGEVAPVTEGVTMDGDAFSLRDLRGQWVVVNFFATWCAGCRQEHPELVEFAARHSERGDASVVSIVWDDSDDDVRSFFADQGGEWPVIVGDEGFLGTSYGVVAVPESYLVAPSGRVVQKFVGATGVTAEALDASIAAVMEAAGG